jgi:pyruvate/2-oxoglutarate/acetoin dehydrogenase E1 component
MREPIPMLGLAVSSSFNYFDRLTQAMTMLAQHPKTLFIGQSIEWDGQAMHKSFEGVPQDRRIEMPVAEDFQMGFCTGLSLQGYIPVCIFPRWDFVLIAANQLINHLDKIPLMSGFRPKVIIRVAVGSKRPFSAGPQHTENHTKAFKDMLRTVRVVELLDGRNAIAEYQEAMESEGSTILVEHMRLYQ